MSVETATSGKVCAAPALQGGGALQGVSVALILGGAAASLAALAGEETRHRFAFAWLWGFAFLWTIVLGSLFFVSIQHITRSVWSVVLRRVAEMYVAPAWLVGLAFVPVALLVLFHGHFGLYPWADPAIVKADHLLEAKKMYLDGRFFTVRAAIFLVIWIAFATFFVRQSLAQDAGGDREAGAGRMRTASAPFLILFGLSVTFASFDWLMSLDPRWFSTIYGVYIFAGMALSGLAAITLTVVWLRSKGHMGDVVTPDHLYSLGGFMWAFTCFWTYIAFSQFMLIWCGNLPEETVFFIERTEHNWLGVSLLLIALRFVLPFLLLLSRTAKMNPGRLALVSVLILAGQLVDLYWLIMPNAHGEGPRLGWQELGPPALLTGLLVLTVARFLSRHRILPAGDPLYDKSRAFHL